MVGRRLGRGLEFFLSEPAEPAPAVSPGQDEVQLVELSRLQPGSHQPRRDFSIQELEELAASIRSSGILQPVLARPHGDGDSLEIVAGERRWRAAKMAGLEHVPVLVRALDETQTAVCSLVENLQRADLNAIEKAKAFARLLELTGGKQEELAARVGLDRSTVANFLRLLELPDEVQAHVARGTLTMGHARALLGLANADEQKTIAEQALRRRMSVREVEAMVRSLNDATAPPQGGGKKRVERGEKPAWLAEIEDTLSEALRTPVSIRYGRKRSRITIECVGRDEFERVYGLLQSVLERGDADG